MAKRQVPSMPKSPPELVDRFAAILERFADVQRRKMFGNASAFAGGNLATGLFGHSWFVRLPDAQRDEALSLPDARPFEPMAGRPMRQYVILPDAVVQDDEAIARWVERSLAYARTLPGKG